MNNYTPSVNAETLSALIIRDDISLGERRAKCREFISSLELSPEQYQELKIECRTHGILSAGSLAVIFPD